MAIAVHPYVTGAAHRIRYFEAIYDHINRHEGVVHWTGEQIRDDHPLLFAIPDGNAIECLTLDGDNLASNEISLAVLDAFDHGFVQHTPPSHSDVFECRVPTAPHPDQSSGS